MLLTKTRVGFFHEYGFESLSGWHLMFSLAFAAVHGFFDQPNRSDKASA